jgi:hypothetical protein
MLEPSPLLERPYCLIAERAAIEEYSALGRPEAFGRIGNFSCSSPRPPPPSPPPPPRRRRPGWADVEYNSTFTLSTLLVNHTLDVVITKFKVKPPAFPKLYPTTITAAGVIATLPDGIARNGAVHVVDRILNPIKHNKPHHGHSADPPYQPDATFTPNFDDVRAEWEDWENWLLEWATED